MTDQELTADDKWCPDCGDPREACKCIPCIAVGGDGGMTALQLNRLLDILDRAVKVAERWADREYPQIDESTEATISRVGDRPLPQTPAEYQAFEPEESPLAKRLRNR